MKFYPNNTNYAVCAISIAAAATLMGFVSVVCLFFSTLSKGSVPQSSIALVVLMSAASIFGVIAVIRFKRSGVYLTDSEIYFRKVKLREVLPSEITTIAIVPKCYATRGYWDGIPRRIMEINGQTTYVPIYAMILMRDSYNTPKNIETLEPNSYYYEHMQSYRKNTIGTALYNSELLCELLKRNPNIEVLADKAFLPPG